MAKKFESIDSNKTGPAKRLYCLRKLLGFSQKECAAQFGVTPGTVALWELGARKIPGPAKRLIEIFEQNPAHFFQSKNARAKES